jgi:hypothetical protein
MAGRLRLYDLRLGELPQLCGFCQSDIVSIANRVNRAQQRLLQAKECGDDGWVGSFAEATFFINRFAPYITCPREISRIEMMDVDRRPVPIRNQFFEYLQFGNGRMPKCWPWRNWCNYQQAYSRNNVCLFVDPAPTPNPFLVKVVCLNPNDTGGSLRTLIQGSDAVGNVIYSLDGTNQTTGQFLPFASPFAYTVQPYSNITGIQKDITQGPVQYFQSDPAGVLPDLLLLTMEPSETTASYRRYYVDRLPCCFIPGTTTPQPVEVKAIVKLALMPVVTDTDYLIIQNAEAIINECQAIRMDGIDSENASGKYVEYHQEAIRLLLGEIVDVYGKNTASISFKPFGSADLRKVNLAMK